MSSRASPRIGIITIRNENEATRSRLSPIRIPVAMVVPGAAESGKDGHGLCASYHEGVEPAYVASALAADHFARAAVETAEIGECQ